MSWWEKTLFKIRHFEFWPFSVFYFPVYFYYLWLSIKHRSFFFFSASNPKIESGGMLGESKWNIFQMIPKQYIPKTYLFPPEISFQEITETMSNAGLGYPIILKPDVGERGWMVEKIKNDTELSSYLKKINVPFLLQEYVSYPLELGVFYVKIPGENKGKITSIVRKGFLSVIGDGKHTIYELLQEQEDKRAKLQFNFNSEFQKDMLSMVPDPGKAITVEGIGNHCRGTTFYNDNSQISRDLNKVFNDVCEQIPDFYFGRFDIRTESYDQLIKGKNFAILELNGAGSEPGHIYQPGYSLLKAYRDVIYHLSLLAKVSHKNHLRGIPYMTFKEAFMTYRQMKKSRQDK